MWKMESTYVAMQCATEAIKPLNTGRPGAAIFYPSSSLMRDADHESDRKTEEDSGFGGGEGGEAVSVTVPHR